MDGQKRILKRNEEVCVVCHKFHPQGLSQTAQGKIIDTQFPNQQFRDRHDGEELQTNHTKSFLSFYKLLGHHRAQSWW